MLCESDIFSQYPWLSEHGIFISIHNALWAYLCERHIFFQYSMLSAFYWQYTNQTWNKDRAARFMLGSSHFINHKDESSTHLFHSAPHFLHNPRVSYGQLLYFWPARTMCVVWLASGQSLSLSPPLSAWPVSISPTWRIKRPGMCMAFVITPCEVAHCMVIKRWTTLTNWYALASHNAHIKYRPCKLFIPQIFQCHKWIPKINPAEKRHSPNLAGNRDRACWRNKYRNMAFTKIIHFQFRDCSVCPF